MMKFLAGDMRIRGPVRVIAAIALLSIVPTIVHAETEVVGRIAALRVEARNSTLREVLSTLGSSLGLRYKMSADLDRSVSGTYNGSLREVLARLLDGYDFFMRQVGDTMEVVIITSATSSPITATTPEVGPRDRTPMLRRDF
jgi:hypothetical protein